MGVSVTEFNNVCMYLNSFFLITIGSSQHLVDEYKSSHMFFAVCSFFHMCVCVFYMCVVAL